MAGDEGFGKNTKDGSELAAEWVEGMTTNWSETEKRKLLKRINKNLHQI